MSPKESDNSTKKTSGQWADTLVKVTPLLSIIIAIGGLAFTVYQYLGQQRAVLRQGRSDQMSRRSGLIRDDLNQIMKFPTDKSITVSQVEALLNDLDAQLKSKVDVDSGKSEPDQNERRNITRILYDLIKYDCDFSRQKDVELSIKVADSWSDYREYLKAKEDLIWDMVRRYQDALDELQTVAPHYIQKIKFDKEAWRFSEPEGVTLKDRTHFRHFEDLVLAYEGLLDLVDATTADGQELKQELIKVFQSATCNREFTQERFGWSVDPAVDPKRFVCNP